MVPLSVENGEPGARRGGSATGFGEVFVLVLIAFLTGILLPVWAESGTEYVPDFLAQMVNPWVLPALGLLWVVRCGSVDLSVWVGFASGWAVAAAILGAGAGPSLALAGVVAVGLILGGVNAAAVAWARLPGWGATGITATVGLSVAAGIVRGLPAELDRALLRPWSGLLGTFWITGLLYIVVLLAMLLGARRWRAGLSARAALAAALVGSGLLSALGGLCGLAKWAQMPARVYLVDDLRPIAAVVLTGAVLLKGPGRSLLAAMLLPPAMLLATVWRQRVWDVPTTPFAVNLIVLAVMALGAQWAMMRASARGAVCLREWPAMAAFLGILALAVTANDLPGAATTALRLAGVGMWIVGAAAAFVQWLLRRRRRTHSVG